jgi:hypothetical protein
MVARWALTPVVYGLAHPLVRVTLAACWAVSLGGAIAPRLRSAPSLTLWRCWTYTFAHWTKTGAQTLPRREGATVFHRDIIMIPSAPETQTTTTPADQGQRLRMSYAEYLAWAHEDIHAEWVNGEVQDT